VPWETTRRPSPLPMITENRYLFADKSSNEEKSSNASKTHNETRS
jgi:hypothetical protein